MEQQPDKVQSVTVVQNLLWGMMFYLFFAPHPPRPPPPPPAPKKKKTQGGNDYEIFESERTVGHTVTSPADTMQQCKELFFKD